MNSPQVWAVSEEVAETTASDLTGTYDVGTITPLERAEALGNKLYLTPEEAAELENARGARMATMYEASDPNREAPPSGGRVGGYNAFWFDAGERATSVDGRFRTSILSHPENGRIPAMTPEGAARMKGFLDQWTIIWRNPDPTVGRNNGKAWWLELPGAGPYDQLEQRPLAERCILGSRSTAGPPMLPNIYNNHKRIVQTSTHVMILTEMNHDARIIRLVDSQENRLDSKGHHFGPPSWLGESVGWFDGNRLIVETQNFRTTPALSGADENLRVTEEFSKQPDGSLLYRFEVDNRSIWSDTWSGEYSWSPTEGDVYEYACHEGNYALGNIMRGARRLEADALNSQPQSQP